jgi:hypothetical protein
MRYGTLAVGALFLAASALFTPAPAADEAVTAQLQQIVDDYQAQNAATEGFTGIELQVSLGDAGPVIAVSPGFAVTGHTRPGATPGKPQFSWAFAVTTADNMRKS